MTEKMTEQTDDVVEIPVGQRADGTVPDQADDEQQVEEQETFPRKYVEELRAESAKHRTEAKEAKDSLLPLQQELFTMKVEKLGKLADPTDLAFDAALLTDEDALAAAVEKLLGDKPHLASRRVVGGIGQGAGTTNNNGDGLLAGLLRANA